MEDSNQEMRAIQQAYWMSLSEEERFRRCGELFSLARRFAEARAPDGLSSEEMKRFVFKEFYGFEMPVEQE